MSLTKGMHLPTSRQLAFTLAWFRFRLVGPFGKDTIRRFANNASQMKKLAAHNFEDLLQVPWDTFLVAESKLTP